MKRLILSLLMVFCTPIWAAADDTGTAVSGDDLPQMREDPAGWDRPGGDFWIIRMGGERRGQGVCAIYCRDTPRCGAYTFVQPQSNNGQAVCYLKNAQPAARQSTCCRSGVKVDWRPVTPELIARNPLYGRNPTRGQAIGTVPVPGVILPGRPPVSQATEDNVRPVSPLPPAPVGPQFPSFGAPIPGVSSANGMDRPGSDLAPGQPGVESPRACAELCRANDECRAYTWVRPGVQQAAPVCWLKGAVPDETPNDCCASGVVDRVGSNNTPPGTEARVYERTPGFRFDGPDGDRIESIPQGASYWPMGLPFNEATCRMACDDPARFSPSRRETRRCTAYEFRAAVWPNVSNCMTYASPPTGRRVADPNVVSAVLR